MKLPAILQNEFTQTEWTAFNIGYIAQKLSTGLWVVPSRMAHGCVVLLDPTAKEGTSVFGLSTDSVVMMALYTPDIIVKRRATHPGVRGVPHGWAGYCLQGD